MCRNPFPLWEVSKYGVFSGPYFPAFGLNTEFYSVNLRIQFKCGEKRIRKNSVFGHFSRSARLNVCFEYCLAFPYSFYKICLEEKSVQILT